MAAMPSPFDALVGAPLNHLLRANHWARESLKPFTGKTVSVRCPPFPRVCELLIPAKSPRLPPVQRQTPR